MLKLKICGLTDPQNIKEIIELAPDMVGFIFYPSSERNIQDDNASKDIPHSIQKVGVFVDADQSTIETMIKKHQLNAIQLYHQDISPFQHLRSNVTFIKAISIRTEADLDQTQLYEQQCDFFLFDTKGEKAGGNGIKFDWRILTSYAGEIPFILSGGIDISDVKHIKAIKHKKIYGIDINSKFEIKPGSKNIQKIKQFKKELYENIGHNK
jgi:phosphoribosylanthranilate isomerase